eukprot:CAMPEP_0119391124 /NCGR_PEP_ID=MMETSP1334-20130426/115980_1 /TAXON_ID=127549 /ORGANISM="Calcidiscus leptoporus, Strain RCC1130" /LENGTH=112 /DNA_ID=CAMNT_0007413751 /DNA_START=34 /DNA_END=373 /DNA_ORIENTATION=-
MAALLPHPHLMLDLMDDQLDKKCKRRAAPLAVGWRKQATTWPQRKLNAALRDCDGGMQTANAVLPPSLCYRCPAVAQYKSKAQCSERLLKLMDSQLETLHRACTYVNMHIHV